MEPTGRLIDGRYQLTSLIATGGMGQVWQARDTVLNRDVAVKVLRSEYTGDPTFLARFRSEAQLSAGLVHPNIATLFDYGEVRPQHAGDEHLAYLVMELVRGESLSQLLHREHRLAPDRTLDVLRQCAAGLAAAHASGVVHRDVKPGNVLLGTEGTVKLTDFGVALSAASVSLTQTGQVIGTAHYLSPEQAQGSRATPASDVYALGLVGYECLAGRRAFDAESSVQVALMQIRDTPAPLPADVPEPVRALIAAAMAKEPAQRIADGAAFRDAVDDVRAGRPLSGAHAADRTTVLPAAADETAVLPPSSGARSTPATRVFAAPVPPGGAGGGARPAGAGGGARAGASGGGARPAPAGAPRRRWRGRLAAAALGLLAVAALVFGVVQFVDRPATGDADPTPAPTDTGTTPGTTAPESPETVTVTAADLVGRPVDEVRSVLAGLGLNVGLVPQQSDDVDPGQVISVSPTGELRPGSTVTVVHASAPATTPAPTGSPTSTPTTTPAPPPGEDEPDEDEADEDEGGGDDQGTGNGEGNGQGGGEGQGNGNGRGRGDG